MMSMQSENIDKLIKEGISYYHAKRYQKCLDTCEQAIQLDPNCARAYHGKGLALAKQKKYEEALIAYQKASHLTPQNAKIHANLAKLLYKMADYEESQLSYKRAIQLDNQFEAIYIEKSKMLRDEALNPPAPYLCPSYMPDWSLNAFREVLLFNPDDAIALTEIEKIQKERKLVLLVRDGRYKEAIEAYLEAAQLNPEDAKLHASLAELLYKMADYEESQLSYKRAIQLDNQFEAIYIEKSKMLRDEAFKLRTPYLRTPDLHGSAINAFREVLLFNPDDAIALTEIEKIQKEVESLRNCPICYMGTLIYTDKHANRANINLHADQSGEQVRIFFLEEVKYISPRTFKELKNRYFSRTADEWRISFTFPLPETYFKVEVLCNELVIAYGLYWVQNGHLAHYAEYNINLTFVYEPPEKSNGEWNEEKSIDWMPSPGKSINWMPSELKSNNWNSIIYIPDRTRKRNRRVRRGS